MAGQYESPISVRDVITAINRREFLLPAIQRKFVWSSQQICSLFDSIMLGYPINTFMMWEVKEDALKNDYKFYEFLKNYCQRFNEENELINTNAQFPDFKAIIDGQQRMTSLYIGLCGTYAYKQPRVWWPSTQSDTHLPPRKLYLDLLGPVHSEDNESMMHFNFRFLTDDQIRASNKKNPRKHFWFCLHKILKSPPEESATQVLLKVVMPYLKDHDLAESEFAIETLSRLYEVIGASKIIHYFSEKKQNIDHVLDVFIRTNSGGTKLNFSDLLVSIAVANWDGDFRKDIQSPITEIHQNVELGFYIERDWILKTCLMLTDADVRFKVKNFNKAQVERIQREWADIIACIKAGFMLVRRLGINERSLTSMNAVIPICYYLYKKQFGGAPLYASINKLGKCDEQRKAIGRWFYRALLKGVFGGQADTILTSMREVIDLNLSQDEFPLGQIVERYKATNKDLRFDEEYIDGLLDIQHGEGRCRALLHLLFPEMNPTEIFHIDHLHPQSTFERKELKEHPMIGANPELLEFFCDPVHWNSIPNLHLLNDSQNMSKKDRPLKDWVADRNVHVTAASLLVEGVDLEFAEFKTFFEKRREALKSRLKQRVYVSASISTEPELDDADEEVVAEAEA